MKVRFLRSSDEIVVGPYASVSSVEDSLLDSEYLVVKKDDTFLGILTKADVIRNAHTLVIDCLVPKPKLNLNDETADVLRTMQETGEYCLPVFNDEGTYMFCVTCLGILRVITEMENIVPSVHLNNFIGSDDFENTKQMFLGELFHHIKNPLQIIQSSVEMLKSLDSSEDSEIYRIAIKVNAYKIDRIITKLYETYF